MTKGWRTTGLSAVLAMVAVLGAAGCGTGGEDSAAKKPSASATGSAAPKSVARLWDEAWSYQVANPCRETQDAAAKEAGCQNVVWDLVTDVRKVRKAMNADSAAGSGFYTDAYIIMDRIDTLAGDMSDDQLLRMRTLIRAQGVDLNRWIVTHPSQ